MPVPTAQELVVRLVDEGYTLTDLAGAAGVASSTIYRWQEGAANARPKNLSGMLMRLGKNPREYGLPAHREDAPAWAVALDAKLDTLLAAIGTGPAIIGAPGKHLSVHDRLETLERIR